MANKAKRQSKKDFFANKNQGKKKKKHPMVADEAHDLVHEVAHRMHNGEKKKGK